MSSPGYYPQNLKYILALAAVASTTVAVYLIYKELRSVKADVIELKRRSIRAVIEETNKKTIEKLTAAEEALSSAPSGSGSNPPSGSGSGGRHVHFSEEELMGCPQVKNGSMMPLHMPGGGRICIPIVKAYEMKVEDVVGGGRGATTSTIEEIGDDTEQQDLAPPASQTDEVESYWQSIHRLPPLVKTVTPCEEIIKSGKRKGEVCGRDSINSDNRCRMHAPKDTTTTTTSAVVVAPPATPVTPAPVAEYAEDDQDAEDDQEAEEVEVDEYLNGTLCYERA